MPEVHTNISTNASNNQVVFHNPAVVASPSGAGQAMAAVTKPTGQANGSAVGQVPNTSVVFKNPA